MPVRAWPIMSVPVRAIGIAMCWIGKGWTMFTSASASTMSGSTPRVAKVCQLGGSGLGAPVGGGLRARLSGPGSALAAVVVSVVRISYFRVRQSRCAHRCATGESIALRPLPSAHECRTRPAPTEDDGYRAGAVDLLGILAYGALTAFERLAEDAQAAPTLPTRSSWPRSPPVRSTTSTRCPRS